jgi:hypothetical protein
VENHPVDAEPIAHLAKASGKRLLSNRHQDLTPVGKGGENAFSLTVTVDSQRQVRTPHRLGIWNVRCPDFRVPIEMRACSTASFHSGLTRLGLGD